MKRWLKIVAGVGGAAMLAAGGEALAQSSGLQPIGSWDLQQAAESCYIVRDFHEEQFSGNGQTFRLRIQSYGEDTPYHISLVGDGVPIRDQRAEAVQLDFGLTLRENSEAAVGLLGKAANGQPMLMITAFPQREVNLVGWLYDGSGMSTQLGGIVVPEAEKLYIDLPNMEPVTLPIGPMKDQYARLDECARTLERKWQIAVEGPQRAVTPPQLLNGKEANWIVNYPEAMSFNRISGLVEMRMTIDEQGRAHDCVVQSSLWNKSFGKDACTNFERWRKFEPAKDIYGKPVRALFRTAVIYAIYDWG